MQSLYGTFLHLARKRDQRYYTLWRDSAIGTIYRASTTLMKSRVKGLAVAPKPSGVYPYLVSICSDGSLKVFLDCSLFTQ